MNRKNYTISEIVDRSEDIVNMAFKEKNISKELLPYLYISFASFYMYYGSEYLNTIYSVYKDSSFLFSKSSNVLTNYMAPSFFEIDDIRDTIKDKVLIKESKDPNLVLHSTIHEINHLINSKRNRLSMKNGYFNEDFIRIGAQVRGIKSGTINNFYINELFIHIKMKLKIVKSKKYLMKLDLFLGFHRIKNFKLGLIIYLNINHFIVDLNIILLMVIWRELILYLKTHLVILLVLMLVE